MCFSASFGFTVPAESPWTLGARWEIPVNVRSVPRALRRAQGELASRTLGLSSARMEVVRGPLADARAAERTGSSTDRGRSADFGACGRRNGLLSYGQASATDIVVGRFFVAWPVLHGLVRPNSRRETAMAYPPPSLAAEPQPKSDPGDAGRKPMGLQPHRRDLRWRSGTGADAAASFSAEPAVTEGTPSERSGRQPIPIPLLDNRTVVTNHQVGRHRTGRLTMASSHTARCAAAGRRSGLRTPSSRSERPDS